MYVTFLVGKEIIMISGLFGDFDVHPVFHNAIPRKEPGRAFALSRVTGRRRRSGLLRSCIVSVCLRARTKKARGIGGASARARCLVIHGAPLHNADSAPSSLRLSRYPFPSRSLGLSVYLAFLLRRTV